MTDAAERLRRRYPPPRVPRSLKVLLISIATAGALSWLVWTALVHSRPAVAGQVSAFTVASDTSISITITVDRRDPRAPANCRVVAQAADFSSVAEQQVPVEASAARVVDKQITLTTLRRATSASVKSCAID